MADSTNAKQMLVTLNSKLDWLDNPHSPVFSLNTLGYPISQKLHERQQQGSRDDSFCKNDYFFGVQQLFFIRKASISGSFNC